MYSKNTIISSASQCWSCYCSWRFDSCVSWNHLKIRCILRRYQGVRKFWFLHRWRDIERIYSLVFCQSCVHWLWFPKQEQFPNTWATDNSPPTKPELNLPKEINFNGNTSDIWITEQPNRKAKCSGRNFYGACLCTRAQQSDIGERQAKAYCKCHKFKFELVRFSDGSYSSLGNMRYSSRFWIDHLSKFMLA